MRIGTGYDVHKLQEGRKLILGGVEIPHIMGLEGHSDADVLIHAIMDALLGAAKQRDIGVHFPPDDNRWKDTSSLIMLARVKEILNDAGYIIGNIDATVIAQKPKIAAFISNMEANIAQSLEIDIGQINIKATTEEGLGFTGSEQGISAMAAVLITTTR